VTLTFKALQSIKTSNALSLRCKTAVDSLRAPPSLSETFGFINAILGGHQLALSHAELRPAADMQNGVKRRSPSPSAPTTPRPALMNGTPDVANKVKRRPTSPTWPSPTLPPSLAVGVSRRPATPPSSPATKRRCLMSPLARKRSSTKPHAVKPQKQFLQKWLELKKQMSPSSPQSLSEASAKQASASSSPPRDMRPAKKQRKTSHSQVTEPYTVKGVYHSGVKADPENIDPESHKIDSFQSAIDASMEVAAESAKILESAVAAVTADSVKLPEGSMAAHHRTEVVSEDLTPKVERPRFFQFGSDPKGIADFVRMRRPKVIVLMGAGASTSAGIPDFRSPGIGLFDQMEKLGIPSPRKAFDLDHFRDHPDHLYSVCKEVWPRPDRGPTMVHKFVRLLHEEGLLLRCYTQNIDGLERAAGIPDEQLVEAHGNFRCATGIDTGRSVPAEEVRDAVFNGGGAEELRARYGELIKPGIMLYGDKLPKRFGRCIKDDFPKCELLIVIGTSLRVAPFCQLVRQVPASCSRLLMNAKPVGLEQDLPGGFNFESGKRDVIITGPCDDGVQQLCDHLGWAKRL